MTTPNTKILALIPARGGSVSIPHKNIVMLGDKPLLGWAVEAAKGAKAESERRDGYEWRIIVSTDDPEISAVARKFGAEVPFKRPANISKDVPTEDVILHALTWLRKNQKWEPDITVLIQCTTPFILPEDINRCIFGLQITQADCCASMRRANEHPKWLFKPIRNLPWSGRRQSSVGKFPLVAPWFEPIVGYIGVRQKLPDLLYPNGGIYALWTQRFLKHRTMFGKSTAAYLMPPERSFDVDEPLDLDVLRAYVEWKRKPNAQKTSRQKKTPAG